MAKSDFLPALESEVPFTTPSYPNLLNDIANNKLRIEMTEESKQFWENGRPGQGYIGILELPASTDPDPTLAKIHLVPSFNRDDGLAKTDKNGNEFVVTRTDKNGNVKSTPAHLVSTQPRGAFTGDLHINAARSLGLGDKGQAHGLLMGFGIWKFGAGVRILNESIQHTAIVPNEYVCTLNNDKTWTVEYIDENLGIQKIDVDNILGLSRALHYLSDKNIQNLPEYEREISHIDEIFADHEGKEISRKLNFWDSDDMNSYSQKIKFAKNRSTSQNMNAVKYDPEYQSFFSALVTNQQAHTLNLKRELPLPIFDIIMKCVCSNLGLEQVGDLTQSTVVPSSKNDDLRVHLQFYNNWTSLDNVPARMEFVLKLYMNISRVAQASTKTFQSAMSAYWSEYVKLHEKNIDSKITELIKYNPAIPLMMVMGMEDVKALDDLIKKYNLNPNAILSNSYVTFSAMQLSCWMDNFDMMMTLINNGANVNSLIEKIISVQNNGEIELKTEKTHPLIWAVERNDVDAAAKLLKLGANVNACNIDNESGLHIAARNNNMEMMKLLIEHNIKIEDYNIRNEMPLHLCESEEAKKLLQVSSFKMSLPESYTKDAKEVCAQLFIFMNTFYPYLENKITSENFSAMDVLNKYREIIDSLFQYDSAEHGKISKFLDQICQNVRDVYNEFISANPGILSEEELSLIEKEGNKVFSLMTEMKRAQNPLKLSQTKLGLWQKTEVPKQTQTEEKALEDDVVQSKSNRDSSFHS